MSTIHDVAQLAGVSIATVSRALHDAPRVSAATRRRVLQAAADLRYVASATAAGLASGHTEAIGVVAPFIHRWFFSVVVHAAEEALRAGGYDLLLYSLGTDDAERRRAFSGAALRKRVDGVLLLGLAPSPEEVTALSAVGGPVVCVGVDVPSWDCVRIDDHDAAQRAVGHLIALGHRRIGFVGDLHEDPLRSYAPARRLHGYRDALDAAGQRPDPALETTGGFTAAGGADAMAELLAAPEPPTAVFAASDEMALGAIATIRRAGLRVPEDVSVIGLDDHELAEAAGLSTVRQPVPDQGRLAAGMLLDALADPDRARRSILLPTELVVRATTGPPPARLPT